jgi:D-alanyl-D-alanine carboxypeptidase
VPPATSLAFQRALIAGELFEHPATTALLTERSNLLRNMIPTRYGLGTWIFRVTRPVGPGRRSYTVRGQRHWRFSRAGRTIPVRTD